MHNAALMGIRDFCQKYAEILLTQTINLIVFVIVIDWLIDHNVILVIYCILSGLSKISSFFSAALVY